MSLTNEEFNTRIDDAVTRTIEQYRKDNVCAIDIDPKTHATEHAFVKDLMKVACKLEKIKWGFLGSVAKTLGGVLIVVIGLGILYMIKRNMGDLP